MFFYLLLAIILFFIGSFGTFLSHKHIIIILVSLELIFVSININFVIASAFLDDFLGQVYAFFLLTIAASESAIGLAILILYFRLRGTIFIDTTGWLKG